MAGKGVPSEVNVAAAPDPTPLPLLEARPGGAPRRAFLPRGPRRPHRRHRRPVAPDERPSAAAQHEKWDLKFLDLIRTTRKSSPRCGTPTTSGSGGTEGAEEIMWLAMARRALPRVRKSPELLPADDHRDAVAVFEEAGAKAKNGKRAHRRAA